eukprot:Nitzschia sp. Nitz4//scaffold76_size158648//57763//58582//NITZ4_002542-RA/size158648-processed-gene-0.237-mRNA-1//1//CDS//3329557833//1385//frame0
MTSSRNSYYDIDAILAEEELIPCTTLFEFANLSHLEPEANHQELHLPEASQIKMPLWSLEKWATLGFVRLSLPRHYSRKARERLEAEPAEADLRKRNECYFLAGRMLVDLIERSTTQVSKVIASSKSSRRHIHSKGIQEVFQEAQLLKRTLRTAFSGERLRRTFDWALSTGGDDDVSHFLRKLTDMEQQLFYQGSSAVTHQEQWKLLGNRSLWLGMTPRRRTTRAIVTPGDAEDGREEKRQRTD